MDLNTALRLREAGVDTEGALRRFGGNSALYERFLTRFLSDETFRQVTEAFENKEEDAALTSAHTLKGVTANLGLTKLYSISSEMVNLIRAGEFDQASARYPDLKAAYDEICGILS